MKIKIFILATLTLLAIVGYKTYHETKAIKVINSYESCVSVKGSVIQTSYPATCVTRLGSRYTQPLTEEQMQSLLPPNTYNDCGSAMPKTNFFFKAPTGWTVIKSDNSELFQAYSIVDPNSQQHFEIACGDGFGGGGYPPEEKTKITIAGTSVESFIGSNPKTGLSTIGLTYLIRDPITYSFTGELERKYLNQIISSFKFTD